MVDDKKLPLYKFSSGNRYYTSRVVPAIVLFPSLMTPEILVGSEPLEILMLWENPFTELTKKDINWALKIRPGLDAKKTHTLEPLSDKNVDELIELKEISLNEKIIKTDLKFSGILDQRILNLYKKKGYDKLYKIKIKHSITEKWMKNEGIYNIFWALMPDENGKPGSEETLNIIQNGKCVTLREPQDNLIWDEISKLTGKKIKENGKYCFIVNPLLNDVDITSIDLANPIQSYHPVFYYKNLEYANVAYLSDLHISSRQNILAKSKARVIDFEYFSEADGWSEADQHISPEIGSIVNICSRNIKKLFDKAGKSSAHIILIGGDLIDYIKNTYLENIENYYFYNPGIKKIWEIVDIGKDYEQNYQDFVDYISFYTLVVYFYRTYQKPVFVVSGNHDCYVGPYGISPRVYWERANENIPADHNLTFYEALLIFGKTFGERSKTFDKDKFIWFYTVLTPFSDFSIQLPKQYLIGMGWGDDENVLGDPIWDSEQGPWTKIWGHLPRANEVINENQLALLKQIIDRGKKILLMSHFTFISYIESIPFDTQDEGDVEFDDYWDPGKHDMGTFETHRKELYEKYLAKNKIQCVLTGHSHRKGVYSILRTDYWGDNSVKTAVSTFEDFTKNNKNKDAAIIIVSDSAGPLPRCNMKKGEFCGWGSNIPSGTLVLFSNDGSISKVLTIDAEVKPRFAVAFDYWALLEVEDQSITKLPFIGYPLKLAGIDLVVKLESDEFYISDERKNRVEYTFNLWVRAPEEISKSVSISYLALYAYGGKRGSWKKIRLFFDTSCQKWRIPGDQAKIFKLHFTQITERALFCSIKFNPEGNLVKQYDFNNFWNFEVMVDYDTSGGGLFGSPTKKKYIFKRDRKLTEIPDFEWRKKLEKYKN